MVLFLSQSLCASSDDDEIIKCREEAKLMAKLAAQDSEEDSDSSSERRRRRKKKKSRKSKHKHRYTIMIGSSVYVLQTTSVQEQRN